MSQPEKFNGLEKIDLGSAEIHAPVEVSVAVYLRLPDGQMGKLTAIMPSGQFPSREAMKLVLDGFAGAAASGDIPGAPVGARMPTRSEFVSHIVKRETGQPFPVDAGAKYAPLPSDIPHQMLVHAIVGTGEPDEDLAVDYIERGLAELTRGIPAMYVWDEKKLAALPDDMLMALYERVTA